MKRIRCAALILALVLGAGSPARANKDPLTNQIQRALDARAASVNSGDRGGFLGTVDPSAEQFRKDQETWFDRIHGVPIEEYSLKLQLDEVPELTRARDRQRYKVPVTVAMVEERFRIKGFDEHPALNRLFYTFVKKQGGWTIASDSDVEDLGLFTARQPWDFGPVEVTTGEHFMVLAHPGRAEAASRILTVSEEALPGVARAWKTPWIQKVVIFVPSTQQELERLVDATFEVSNFVAVAVSSIDTDQGWFPVSRVMVNPATFLNRTPQSQRTILTHELVHIATRRASGPFLSSLIEEGLAQVAEYEAVPPLSQLGATLGRRGFDGKLPDDADFFTGGGPSIRLAYLKALSAIAYLIDRFGIDRAGAFYTALGSARIEPGTARFHLDRVLREALGVSFDEFERDWSAAVRRRA